MYSEQVRSHFDILPDSAIHHSRSMRGSNTSAVGRNQEHNGGTKVEIVWELVWMAFGSPPASQLLIVADRLQDMGGCQGTLQRGSHAQLGTKVESPSTDTEPATSPYSEHPDDILASWR